MNPKAQALEDLPQSFRNERSELLKAGIDSWTSIRNLEDQELSRLARSGRASVRNLYRLRGIAVLVCDMDLAPQDAALLMHAGIATTQALAGCTPERLVRQTGRLERNLGTGRPAVIDQRTAGRWIRRARQLEN